MNIDATSFFFPGCWNFWLELLLGYKTIKSLFGEDSDTESPCVARAIACSICSGPTIVVESHWVN